MLADKGFFGALLWIVYFGILEILSRAMSESPLCILISEKDQADNQTSTQTCATLFEGIARLGRFIWESATHDNVIAFGTVLIAFFTFTLYRSTTKLWEAGERQMELIERNAVQQSRDMQASIAIAQGAAKAAERSADIAERTLLLSDRPWIAIEPKISGELAFSADTIDVFITITVKNVGRSPATHVSVNWKMCASMVGAAEEGRKSADSARRMMPAALGIGHVLFPNEEFSYKDLFVSLPTADFLRDIQERMKLQREAGHVPENFGFPAFMFFVQYGLPSAGRTGRYRFTTLLMEVWRKGSELGFDGGESSFDAEALELVQTPLSGETI